MAILPGWRHLPPPSQSQVAATLKRNHRRLWKVIIYMNWWTHPPPPPPPSSLLPSSQPPEHTTAQLGSLFPRICTISSARLPLHSALIRRGGGLNRRWFIRLKFDFFFLYLQRPLVNNILPRLQQLGRSVWCLIGNNASPMSIKVEAGWVERVAACGRIKFYCTSFLRINMAASGYFCLFGFSHVSFLCYGQHLCIFTLGMRQCGGGIADYIYRKTRFHQNALFLSFWTRRFERRADRQAGRELEGDGEGERGRE